MLSPLRAKCLCLPTFVMMKRSAAAGLLHLAGAVAGRAGHGVAARVARAVAARALLGAADRDVRREARHGLLERERERHLDVGALLRHRPRRLLLGLPAAEQLREDVAEGRAAARGRGGRGVAPVEAREV